MSKTVEETNCDPRLALAWAVSSHNSLCNHLGFSPNQLVFGFNPNYPSVLSDDLPALDTTTSNDLIRKMLNMKHTSWKQFVEAENSNRIRRALSHNVRTYSDVKFTNGDVVYYRRKNFKGWRGPGVVLGQEGQCVAVRHQGEIYKVHPHQLLLREHFQAKGGSGSNHEGSSTTSRASNVQQFPNLSNLNPEDAPSKNETSDSSDTTNEVNGTVNSDQVEYLMSAVRPKRNTVVKYKLQNDGWKLAKVLSHQPKQTGQYKNWFNIQEDDDVQSCVNWDHVELWKEVEGTESAVFLTGIQHKSQEVVDAKEKELQNLIDHDVFKEVPYNNQPTVSSRWVITEKLVDGKKCYKARLVARSFEEVTDKLQRIHQHAAERVFALYSCHQPL